MKTESNPSGAVRLIGQHFLYHVVTIRETKPEARKAEASKVREASMWSVLVFLAGVIFLMKGSADITKEAQARKRQLRREARRNAELRRREQMQAQLQAQAQMQAQYRAQMDAARRSSASSERERQARCGRQNNVGYGYDLQNGARSGYVSYSVMGYGYAPNRKPIRRKTQRRPASERAPQPVLTA